MYYYVYYKGITMKKIDIIIPAFKAQKTIVRALSSIAMQTIVDQCTVTIVNDHDEIGYSDVTSLFKNVLDVRELVMSENGGPGVARQVGIEHTTSPFVTFIDADDTYESAYSLELLLREMEKQPSQKISMIGGNFVESVHSENGDVFFVLRKNDHIWMFGKLYRREFLDKYQISFNKTRSNEDNGFNTLVNLCADGKEEEPIFLDRIVYCWHFNPNSITRINDYNYTYNANILGYSENMSDAIYRAFKQKGATEKVVRKIIEVMVMMYVLYVGTIEKDPRYIDQNYAACLKYYKDIYQSIEGKVDAAAVKQVSQFHLDRVSENLKGFIPKYTYTQFMELMVSEKSRIIS